MGTFGRFERSWGPVICGALLGLTQFITVVVVSEGCALKDTFLPLISQITRANKKMFQKEDFPLLHKKRNVTAANFWQFLFAIGIYLGGFLSTWLTENDKFLQPTGIGRARRHWRDFVDFRCSNNRGSLCWSSSNRIGASIVQQCVVIDVFSHHSIWLGDTVVGSRIMRGGGRKCIIISGGGKYLFIIKYSDKRRRQQQR